jgi:hypothetical protein
MIQYQFYTPTLTPDELQLLVETLEYRYEKMQNAPFSKYLEKECEKTLLLITKFKKLQEETE